LKGFSVAACSKAAACNAISCGAKPLTAAKRIGDDDEIADLDRLVCGTAAPVDLLFRTGEEQRLSDFVLWECAFAELYFSGLHWPEFDAGALREAVAWFHQRSRRFGG
jgi:undecaprenyl diphosphate synthase